MKTTSILIILLVAFTTCKPRNKLKTDEEKLSAQIENEEMEKLNKGIDSGYETTAVADTFPPGIRYQPERSIDPNIPPEIIDIAGNINNIKEFRLSDFVKDINYIRLQPPTDSAFLGKLNNKMQIRRNAANLKEELPFSIVKNNDYIVAYNHLGMLLYDTDGKLLQIISKNKFTGFTLYKGGVAGGSGSTFKGAYGNPRLEGDKLYYNNMDDVNNTSKIMEVNCNSVSIFMPSSNENNNDVWCLGEPISTITGKRYYSTIPLSMNSVAQQGHPQQHEDMLTIFNSRGDTLCTFPGNQKIENYTKSLGRTPDWGNKLFYKGNFYFREAHSDTIFKVVPPSKLITAFIINLGEYKVANIQEGMDPSFDLSNTFMPKTITVTDDFVFIYYTQGYNSPNARKKKAVKFFHAVYNRKTKELWHIKSDPHDHEFALQNDLDGGLPVWPGKFNFEYFVTCTVSENGEIIQSVKGIELKRYVQSDEFKNSVALENKKHEFLELANKVADYETIVIEMK